MLLVHPVIELVRFLPILVGIFILGSGDRINRFQVIGLAIPVALGVMRFLTTTFRITASQVELRRGLIGQKVVTARLDRVRAVELTSSPIHRILGLAKVEIGTAGGGKQDEDKFALDALPVKEAREMRTALLHRVETAEQLDEAAAAAAAADPGTPGRQRGDGEQVLVRLDPRWVRYAPLTSAGNVIAAGFLAVVIQFGEWAGLDLAEGGAVEQWLLRAGVLMSVLLAMVSFLVIGAVLAVLGYLVSNWRFNLARETGGRSFRSARGLLTHTETSLETARLRGVELGQPLGLRLAGAARLNAIVTGLPSGERSSTLLVPPAPREVVVEVGETVIDLGAGELSPLRMRLQPHGPAARRRRLTRALAGVVLLLAALAVAAAATSTVPWTTLLGAALLLPLAAWLGHDRYRQLGHALSGGHLVAASGTFRGRRQVLHCSGIIGWNIEQSFFQRRAGLVTLIATTAAGKQRYAVVDVPEATAVALADATVPGLLTPFLT